MGTRHRKKPDFDNVCKALADSLFKNDEAISDGTIKKRWGEPERMEVEIEYE